MLKRAAPYILVAPDETMWNNILKGDKKITIRAGLREYHVGDRVMLCCHIIGKAVMAEITGVFHGRLNAVPLEMIQADGFQDHMDALNGLRAYYPQMTQECEVTVVTWDNLRGALANQGMTSPL